MNEEELKKETIEALKRAPPDFSWCPKLEIDAKIYHRDELIREIEKDSEDGRQFIRMIYQGTLERLRRQYQSKD